MIQMKYLLANYYHLLFHYVVCQLIVCAVRLKKTLVDFLVQNVCGISFESLCSLILISK